MSTNSQLSAKSVRPVQIDSKFADLSDDRVPPELYWSIDEVGEWIEKIGFDQYKDCFVSNFINGRKLIWIDASHLPKIGVSDYEHIKIKMEAIFHELNATCERFTNFLSKSKYQSSNLLSTMASESHAQIFGKSSDHSFSSNETPYSRKMKDGEENQASDEKMKELQKMLKTSVGDKYFDQHHFRQHGSEIINFIIEYLENQKQYKVFPDVKPGYLKELIPNEPPQKKENFETIMSDFKEKIIPGITHWHHPNFHAYFPAANSYAGLLGEMLSSGIGCIGFTWASSPACTELEVVMLDWLVKMLNLPDYYLSESETGGGVIMSTCSEATLVSLFAARTKVIKRVKEANPDWSDYEIMAKLRGYYSIEAHSSVERAGLLSMLNLQPIQSRKEDNSMDTEKLREQIEQDIDSGFIPFFVCATLGTTSTCAFDRLWEIGPLCEQNDIWLHVDAAYAGSAFICPEYQSYMKGIEYSDSFVFNPHKWMLVNFDCSTIWFKDARSVVKSFTVDPVYLKYKEQGKMPDFRHWHIPLGRKFRSLKIWFVLRLYGVEGLQEYVRNHIRLAKYFESLMKKDERFEIIQPTQMGLVCFRLRGENTLSNQLYEEIERDGRIHLVVSTLHDEAPQTLFLRFALCYQDANSSHVDFAFNVITEITNRIHNQKKMIG